jgi:hypothetical protein
MRMQTKAKKIKKKAQSLVDPKEKPIVNYEKYDEKRIIVPKNPMLTPT